jgi:hypothetical protein
VIREHNGLYWSVSDREPPSPLGRLGDFTKDLNSTGADGQPQFNGYSYRILTKGHTASGAKNYVINGKMTGGFAILAYPAEYRNSGIMSFVVSEDGTVYQKDLGDKTTDEHWTSASISTGTASRTKP